MIKKHKLFIIVFSILFCMMFKFTSSYADNSTFLTPNLVINDEGIKFDSNSTEKSFSKAENEVESINTLLGEYRLLITFGSGVVAITMIGIFIVNLIKLGNSRGNPQARSKAIAGLIFTGLATALAGSVTMITGLVYNFIG